MTKWPWLMIILALISTVQWPNSVAQYTFDYNSYDQDYLWFPRKHYPRPRRTSMGYRENTTPITTTLRSFDHQKIEPRANIKSTNVRHIPASDLSKPLFKNEYLTNDSSIHSSNDFKLLHQSKSSIVFPNSIEEKVPTVPVNKFIPQPHAIEKCSKNSSFCTKVDNYPRQDLQHIFRTSKFMSPNFFGVDTMNDLETRISNTNLQSLCDSKEEIIFPEAGVNKNNEWRYIVQDLNNENSNFKQGILVEKCSSEGNPCKFSEHLPLGYTTTCVQKYIYKKLVAIKDSKEVYYESFKLPSCCACMYNVNSELLTRIGVEADQRLFQPEPTKKIKDVFNTKT